MSIKSSPSATRAPAPYPRMPVYPSINGDLPQVTESTVSGRHIIHAPVQYGGLTSPAMNLNSPMPAGQVIFSYQPDRPCKLLSVYFFTALSLSNTGTLPLVWWTSRTTQGWNTLVNWDPTAFKQVFGGNSDIFTVHACQINQAMTQSSGRDWLEQYAPIIQPNEYVSIVTSQNGAGVRLQDVLAIFTLLVLS